MCETITTRVHFCLKVQVQIDDITVSECCDSLPEIWEPSVFI